MAQDASEIRASLFKIEAGDFGYKGDTYYIITVKDKKYQSEPSQAHRIPSPVWNTNIQFTIEESNEKTTLRVSPNLSGELRIVFMSHNHDSWKIKKDKYLGEASFPMKDIMLNGTHSPTLQNGTAKTGNHVLQAKLQQLKRPRSGTSSVTSTEDLQPADPDTVPAEVQEKYVRLHFEISGYRAILFMLQSSDQTIQVSALRMLQDLFDVPKSRKATDYVQEYLLKQLKKMAVSSAQAPADPKVVELLSEIAATYNKLLRRDDETLLLMVKLGIVKQILGIIKKISEKEANFVPCKAAFIDLLKNFFKFVNHQQILIERGALKLIAKWIQSRYPVIQTKAYEIILKFDSVHQPLMIKEGILNLLASIITGEPTKGKKTDTKKSKKSKKLNEKSKSTEQLTTTDIQTVSSDVSVKSTEAESVQMQTKTLAVIQYFDATYKQEIVSCGIIPQLMKLLNSDKPAIQLKTLAVLHHFHDGLHQLLISEGLLRTLHKLIQSPHTQLQLSAFSTLQLFTSQHTEQLIQEGILNTLIQILNPTTSIPTDIKQKALDLIAQFQVGHLVKSDMLQLMIKLATEDKSQQIQDRSFDTLVKMMEPEYQEVLVQQGILDELLSIVTVPIDLSDDQESQAFLDEATSMHNRKLSEGLDIIEVELEIDKEKPPPTRSNLKWACAACTFLNEAELTVCAICEGPKPTNSDLLLINDVLPTSFPSDELVDDVPNQTTTDQTNTQQSNMDSTLQHTETNLNGMEPITQELTDLDHLLDNDTQKQLEDLPAEWACPACTFFNNAASVFCEICETPKPQPQRSTPPLSSPIIHSEPNVTTPDALPNVDNTEFQAADNILPAEQSQALNANPYSIQQQQRALEVIRRFDVPYQNEMIHKGILKYLKKLIGDPDLQQDVLKTIAYFNSMYHEDIIKEGVLIKMCQVLNQKNVKQFLSIIESFEGYQEELFRDKKFIPLMKLLSIDNFLVQPRICQFILNLHRKYWDCIIAQLQDILSSGEPDPAGTKKAAASIKVDRNGVPIPPPLPRFSKLKAGSLKSKLPTGKASSQSKESNTSVNYALMSFAKQLLWQVEHHGIHLLEYKVIYCDGGQSSKKLGVNNILTPQSTVYSSNQSTNSILNPVNIVLRFKSRSKSNNNNNNNSNNNKENPHLVPYLTHVFLRAPKAKFDSPLRTAVIFVSASPPDIKATKKFDKLSHEEFVQQFGNASQNNQEEGSPVPLAFLETDADACAEAALPRPVRADYLHIKLLTAAKQQFDVEYIGFAGVTVNPSIYQNPPDQTKMNNNQHPLESCTIEDMIHFAPDKVEGISSYLGVKRRIKRFEYKSDFDTNGVLHWIGSDENEKAWTNPSTNGQVTLITSHNMYTLSMRVEDIISRTGGTSTYWGGSAPQYFILDLKQRKLLCNYFTLRHGYQAANSYIQDWELSGSNDCVTWVQLFANGDTPFSRAFDVKSWALADGKDYFRYFRVLQKGNYSMGRGTQGGGSPYLCVAGFELYGELQLF